MTNEEAVKKDHDTRVEPFIELPLQALKIRRNLLLCCFFVAQYSLVRPLMKVFLAEDIESKDCLLNICLMSCW